MVETLPQKPFEDRPSQKVGVADYLKESVVWGMLPFTLGAAAVAVGKLSRYKIFPLDGSPSLLQHGYEELFKVAARDIADAKLVIDEDRFGFARWGMNPQRAKILTKDSWNFLKTFEVAALPTIYHFWRHSERQRISLTPLHQRLQGLSDLKPSDAELRAENASLQQQLDYVQRHEPASGAPQPHVGAVQAEGRVAASSRGLEA